MLKTDPDGRNILRLYGYNFFTSLAVTIAAHTLFLDKLLLRLELDLSRFGVIKGSMYVASALLYMIFTPFLQRNPGRSDKLICIWAYLFRAAVPVLLPVIAMFTGNQNVLTWSAVVLLSLGMTLAAFANNSLMNLYRLVLPKEHFNRRVGMMNLLMALPSSLFALLTAYILDRYESAELHEFLIAFTVLQLIYIFFEVPAMVLMKRLELPVSLLKPHLQHTMKDLWKPWLDRAYLPVMLLVLFHGLVTGAWGVYLNVYLMQILGFSMSALSSISLALSLLLTCTLPWSGQITDRIGYKRMFLLLSAGCLAGGLVFCVFPGNLWMLIPFALLLWDGGISLFAGSFGYGLYAAGSKLARSELSTCYISAFGVCRNGGIFLGSLLGAQIYGCLAHYFQAGELFFRYFWSILPLSAVLLIVSAVYRFMKSQAEK